MSNILLRLGISAPVLTYFNPYLETLTEDSAVFRYQDGSNREVFQDDRYMIPGNQTAWTVHPLSSLAVCEHFLFYSALESLCFFSLHPRWLLCPSCIAVSAVGLSPNPDQVVLLIKAFPNARLHFAFGNDLPGQIMDCQIPLWLNQQRWRFSYHHGQVYIHKGRQTFSIIADNFSCANLLGHGIDRRFKKERPRRGRNSFFEQLKYP